MLRDICQELVDIYTGARMPTNLSECQADVESAMEALWLIEGGGLTESAFRSHLDGCYASALMNGDLTGCENFSPTVAPVDIGIPMVPGYGEACEDVIPTIENERYMAVVFRQKYSDCTSRIGWLTVELDRAACDDLPGEIMSLYALNQPRLQQASVDQDGLLSDIYPFKMLIGE
jgi:hypothetical protein